MLRHCLCAIMVAASLGGVPSNAAAKSVRLKIATLAPEGSTWWKLLQSAAQQVKERTDGRVNIRIYGGGVAGDEPDVVRKMRVGQLHGAAITSVGLAEIAPHLLVLQAPGLFGTWDELDHVRRVMSDELEQMLADKGFRNLLWGDVGFNQVFSNVPVKAPSDLRGTKPWCWTQDGVYRAFYDAMGVQPVLVGVPEVLPSLQTGMIDGLIVAPLVSVSLQWFSRLKYMLDMKQSVTIGAVVITEDALQKLEEADRQVLYEVAKELAPRIQKAVRRDNERAVLAVRNAGIQIQQPDAASQQAWAEAQKKAADGAAGEVYPKELLERVRKAVTQYRSGS